MNYPNDVKDPWLIKQNQKLDEKGFISLLDEGTYPRSMVRHFMIGNLQDLTSRGGHAHRLAWQILCNTSPQARVTAANIYGDFEFLLSLLELVLPLLNLLFLVVDVVLLVFMLCFLIVIVDKLV